MASSPRAARAERRSLAAPFGVDSRGMPAVLDPHEAFDGPHGLVAGTTGSGKSELLVSWILSTCVAFPPEQASFVLVDYKCVLSSQAFGLGLRWESWTVFVWAARPRSLRYCIGLL